MRRIALVFVLALIVPAAAAGGTPGTAHGWPGVAGPGGRVHFVASSHGGATTVAAVRTRDRHLLRERDLKGSLGIPRVAEDGTTGGVSADGRTLVVASRPGPRGTAFAVLSTSTLRLRHRFTLDGIWSFDAISPDGTRIYLIEYADPTYSVRVYDLAGGLQDGVIVDKREANEQMQGYPVSRVEPGGGGWAYTLYARHGKAPFVHALDTINGAAYCIDLPWRIADSTAAKLRLRLEGSLLVVRKPGVGRVASVNLQSLRATSIRRP